MAESDPSFKDTFASPATKPAPVTASEPRKPSDNGPFDRLPIEITTAILDEVLRDFGPIKVGELDEGRLSVALTCRLWADIFFRNPRWWTAVETHSRMRWGEERKLAAILKRSRNLPLELVLDGWNFVPATLKLTEDQVPRLRTLTCKNSCADKLLDSIASLPLPRLKTFTISQPIQEDMQLSAPLLEELKFVGAWDGYRGGKITFAEGGRPALRVLHVERNWDDFIRLLTESSQSIRSFLAIDLGSQRPCPIHRIVLPSLTSCHLQGHGSWSCLLMMDPQNLEAITFTDWEPESEPVLPLRLLPSVRTVEWSGKLEIHPFIFNDTGDLAFLKRILRRVTPAITKLVLNHNEPYRHAITDVIWHTPPNPGLVNLLCNSDLCPELQELHIRGRSWLTLPDIELIVAARQGTLRRVTVERVGRGEHTSEEIQSAMEYLLELLEEIRLPSEDQWVVSADDVQDE
ncbi:hypothetical protein FRC00_006092 [Tulasnella sp. 408]|nr:hypothetical protein FRC00_006092 [Tulasnella sp. 408]